MESKIFERKYYLLPGECNARQRMPIWLLANRIIEVATLHADTWNAGYRKLSKDNHAWVLSRMTLEMKEYPLVGTDYVLSTWIESYNRHFSERNVEISDGKGKIYGYARTVWSVIDIRTRESCDISSLSYMLENTVEKECPIEKASRIKLSCHNREGRYVFRYSDIDFNRHVNTVRYICLFINQWDMNFYDCHEISRLEISFLKEGYEGTEVVVGVEDLPEYSMLEISDGNTTLCKAKIFFRDI